MPIEFEMLAYSIILGLVYIIANATSATAQRGLRWAFSSREANLPPLTGIAGRLERALRNFLETFPLFVGAVFLVYALNNHNDMTKLGAQLYFWARVAYLPAYALGIILVRTLVWGAATAGIVLVLVGVMQ